MEHTVAQAIAGMSDPSTKQALRKLLNALADRLSSTVVSTPGLVIKAGASALVKTGAVVCNGVAAGKPFSIAAATDMAALSGTVTNAKFNLFVYYIDSAGVLTTVMGTEGATLAAVKWPQTPEGKAIIGYTTINPTGTGNFVGGTTAIDDATVVPNAVHVSAAGPLDPSLALG